MKKLITLISAVSVGFIISCGPSAEEQARTEQARQDSINQVMEQARQDSMTQAMEKVHQDSITHAQALRDSAMADSLAQLQTKVKNMSKPKPKTKPDPTPTKPEEVKPGQGRG